MEEHALNVKDQIQVVTALKASLVIDAISVIQLTVKMEVHAQLLGQVWSSVHVLMASLVLSARQKSPLVILTLA